MGLAPVTRDQNHPKHLEDVCGTHHVRRLSSQSGTRGEGRASSEYGEPIRVYPCDRENLGGGYGPGLISMYAALAG